jgi:branched-chain amino acid transport system substrate-binding protein
MSKRVLARYLALGLVAIAMLVTSGCQRKPTEVVIAAAAPMTDKYGEMGKDMLAAVQMAVEERNAAGGIGGMKIRLVVEDDKGSPKDAVSIAHKLVGDPQVLGVVGHLNSGTTLPATAVYSEGGLALVMPVPTNPDITKQGFKNLFRIPITDDKQGPACVGFMLDKLGKKRIAVIHNKDAYGEGIATEARKALESRGITPLCFEGTSAANQDFRAVLTRVKGLRPDAVFFGGGYSEGAIMIKQARELGLAVPFVMGDGCFDSQLMQIAGPAADGCYVSNIAPTSAPGPRAAKFFQDFEAKNGKIVAFAPLGYVATCVLLDAIEKAPDKTRAAVLSVLQSPDYRYDSILGEFSFEANGDSRGQRAFMHVIEDGKFKTVAF